MTGAEEIYEAAVEGLVTAEPRRESAEKRSPALAPDESVQLDRFRKSFPGTKVGAFEPFASEGDDVTDGLPSANRPLGESPAHAAPTRRTSWTAPDLVGANFAEPRFAVDDLIPEGLTFMAGAPKLGKSWMALGLSIAVAAGGRALGSISVEAGEVLYLALEDSPRRLQSRLGILLDGDPAPGGLQIETEWPRMDAGGAERLDEWLDHHSDARLVLVDVWPRVRPRAGGRADFFTADYDGAAQLQELATHRGVAIVALFHTRKAESDDFVETVQGTFGTAAAADTIIVVKRSRGQADATLYVTGRDVSERELALRFEPSAGAWTLLGEASEYALGKTRKELLDAVRAHGSLTPKLASEVTSIDHELAKKTLQRMASDGQLVASRGQYSLVTPVPNVPVSPG